MLFMINKRRLLLAFVCLSMTLSGCASLKGWVGPESSLFGGGRVTSAGVDQLFEANFEDLNKSVSDVAQKDWPTWNIMQRNDLQDRIIAAANQRCGLYQTYLKQLQGKVNVTLGTLATALGGVGAIVTAADIARALAGSAGIVSGSRAEFNQGVFLNAAIPVILKGIEQRRARLKKDILDYRDAPVATYTVALAVADAIDYHNACSIGKGLEEAHEALQLQENPGLAQLAKTFELLTTANQDLTKLSVAKAKDQIEALKLQKEIEELKAELKKLKDKGGTNPNPDPKG